jgi:hypothetical protein
MPDIDLSRKQTFIFKGLMNRRGLPPSANEAAGTGKRAYLQYDISLLHTFLLKGAPSTLWRGNNTARFSTQSHAGSLDPSLPNMEKL